MEPRLRRPVAGEVTAQPTGELGIDQVSKVLQNRKSTHRNDFHHHCCYCDVDPQIAGKQEKDHHGDLDWMKNRDLDNSSLDQTRLLVKKEPGLEGGVLCQDLCVSTKLINSLKPKCVPSYMRNASATVITAARMLIRKQSSDRCPNCKKQPCAGSL